MADENASIDDNKQRTLMGVTDDVAAQRRNIKVDPTTGRLLCSATLGEVTIPTDIADGTAGELLTWAADDSAAVVAAGTATHVLTSNGAGAAPTFQAAGGGSSDTSWLNAGSVCSEDVSATTSPSLVSIARYFDNAEDTGAWNTLIPDSKTGIGSIKVYYLNTFGSGNVYLNAGCQVLDPGVSATANQDLTLTDRAYAATTNGNVESFTLNGDVFNGISAFSGGEVFSFALSRKANVASDTYNDDFDVLGILVTWS